MTNEAKQQPDQREETIVMAEQENTAEQNNSSSALTWRNENNSVPKLTIERARQLVNVILQGDDDDEARALVELVTGIAYEQDAIDRDGLALWATREAYSLTMQYSLAVEWFATKAAPRQ